MTLALRVSSLRPRRVRLLGAVLATALLTAITSVSGTAGAYPGAPWFQPGVPYNGNFPDPSVVRAGSTYYAYATATGGSYVPVMTSHDLRTWTPRPAYDPGRPLDSDPYFNDALPYPPRWAAHRSTSSRLSTDVWAPSAAPVNGRWVLFYAVLSRVSPARMCLSVATSRSPLGPFRDTTSAPLWCDSDPAGSIDPHPFQDPRTKQWWLLWKSEGWRGHRPTRIWSRPLNSAGTGFARGSTRHFLLETAQRWEGNVIENPSMISYRGRYYVFYSGNEWASASYATSYATCSGPAGPCKRPLTRPLLAATRTILGPGGASAFADAAGRLRLGYAAWNAPYTNYPAYPACASTSTCTSRGQRRLHIATLSVDSRGLLHVAARDV